LVSFDNPNNIEFIGCCSTRASSSSSSPGYGGAITVLGATLNILSSWQMCHTKLYKII